MIKFISEVIFNNFQLQRIIKMEARTNTSLNDGIKMLMHTVHDTVLEWQKLRINMH